MDLPVLRASQVKVRSPAAGVVVIAAQSSTRLIGVGRTDDMSVDRTEKEDR